MSDDYKVQVSLKVGQGGAGMVNIRGNSVVEVDGLLADTKDLLLPALAGFEEEAKAIGLIAATFPGTTGVPQAQQQGYAQPAQQPAAASNGGAQTCQHGAMIWRTGADWAGWFCPAQRTDPTKCKPRYQR